jgi:hypothetical protein
MPFRDRRTPDQETLVPGEPSQSARMRREEGSNAPASELHLQIAGLTQRLNELEVRLADRRISEPPDWLDPDPATEQPDATGDFDPISANPGGSIDTSYERPPTPAEPPEPAPGNGGLADAASRRVESIIAAAERAADEIRAAAEADAERIRDAAAHDAESATNGPAAALLGTRSPDETWRFLQAIDGVRAATAELERALSWALDALGVHPSTDLSRDDRA